MPQEQLKRYVVIQRSLEGAFSVRDAAAAKKHSPASKQLPPRSRLGKMMMPTANMSRQAAPLLQSKAPLVGTGMEYKKHWQRLLMTNALVKALWHKWEGPFN